MAVWFPNQKINLLESVQKFALRVCSRQQDTSYHTLLTRYSIPSLSNRRLLLQLCFLFNVINGTFSLPDPSPTELMQYHHYSRSHHLTLKVQYCLFFSNIPCHRNSLPLDIVATSNIEISKKIMSLHCSQSHE